MIPYLQVTDNIFFVFKKRATIIEFLVSVTIRAIDTIWVLQGFRIECIKILYKIRCFVDNFRKIGGFILRVYRVDWNYFSFDFIMSIKQCMNGPFVWVRSESENHVFNESSHFYDSTTSVTAQFNHKELFNFFLFQIKEKTIFLIRLEKKFPFLSMQYL